MKPPKTHIKQTYCHSTLCKDFRSWVRAVCGIPSRLRQSWWSCDICEHCVPVNVITHYPLSLPAQAEWLHFSLSPSLPFCLSVSVILFTIALLPFYDVQWNILCCKEHCGENVMNVSINCFYRKLNGNAHSMIFWCHFSNFAIDCINGY